MHQPRIFIFCFFLLFLSLPSFSQTNPACQNNWINRGCSSYPVPNQVCTRPNDGEILIYGPTQNSTYSWTAYYCQSSCNRHTNFAGYYNGKCNYMANPCPSGQEWVYTGTGFECQAPPQCEAGPAGTHSWPASGNLTCVGQCAVTQTGDSTCTGTPAEGGICTATFDFTGAVCPDEGDDGGSGSSGSSASGGGGSSSGQSSSSGDGGDGGDGGDDGGGDSSSGSGSSGGSASSSGNGGVCPPGQISQGTLNGNAICVGQCPTGQYWGAVNGVYGCYGGNGSSSGSGSSDGTGECDPQSKDYAKCIGQINDVDDGLSDQIVGDATGEAEDRLNDAYDSLMEDVEEFSGIDSEFSGAPNQLMSALQGFLPAPVGCSNVPLTFMGYTASLDCNLFNDFKLAFGWFLSILTAVYIWSLATKPVQR